MGRQRYDWVGRFGAARGQKRKFMNGRFRVSSSRMIHWYRVVVESSDPVDAEQKAVSLERAIKNLFDGPSRSPSIRVYYDWLPAGRGRVFWLSTDAFVAVTDLAHQHVAEAYDGLVDMRYLVPLFD